VRYGKNFKTVNRFVALFKSIFTHCSARKRRYKDCLALETGFIRHAKYIQFYKDFIANELEVGDATVAMTELNELFQDHEGVAEDVAFIAANALRLVDLLTWFESSDKVMDLLAWAEYERSIVIKKYKKVYEGTVCKLSQYYRCEGRRLSQP
jgi:hypothetical protein